MVGLEGYKPAMAMIGLQCTYAVMALTTREAMLDGMSPSVFVVYRQAIATIVIVPIAYFCSWRKETTRCSMSFRSFCLIFVTSLIGVTINQNLYFEGIYLVSSSMASAMNNLIPAITFIIAFLLGLETMKIREARSIAKVGGTVMCVGGASVMTLLRGPVLLDAVLPPLFHSFLGTTTKTWFIGCACLLTSCCCWSIWLILQVPVTRSYPDHVSLSAWMCLMATFQSAAVALCFEHKLSAWKLFTTMDVVSYLVSGIGGSAIAFFLQAWCISVKGPVFSAMFNPVCTIVTTILAAIILKEDIYLGSLIGAIVVIIGLYIVLWGKAKDLQYKSGDSPVTDESPTVQVLIDDPSEEHKEPLLTN